MIRADRLYVKLWANGLGEPIVAPANAHARKLQPPRDGKSQGAADEVNPSIASRAPGAAAVSLHALVRTLLEPAEP